MRKPRRIQRKRVKGWQMPEGTLYVGRGSRWGNPWRVVGDGRTFSVKAPGGIDHGTFATEEVAKRHAISSYRWQIENHPIVVGFTSDEVRTELADRDLACWCPLDQPCHADVLLEMANSGPP